MKKNAVSGPPVAQWWPTSYILPPIANGGPLASCYLLVRLDLTCSKWAWNLCVILFQHTVYTEIIMHPLCIVFKLTVCTEVIMNPFYPTALKGCRGIVFTHGVRMGGRPGRREIVCPGCISEILRCRKLILGRDIG